MCSSPPGLDKVRKPVGRTSEPEYFLATQALWGAGAPAVLQAVSPSCGWGHPRVLSCGFSDIAAGPWPGRSEGSREGSEASERSG